MSIGGLPRYVIAATLARTADGGAVVAIVLLVATSGAPGWLVGLLGAAITAPHLFGPFIARWLDIARDGRTVIALACIAHGGALAAAVLLYPVVWPAVTGLLLIISGAFGPLLTGGISSRLPPIVGADVVSQRRAQGWDVATYGIGGTVGPAIVAAVSAWASPTIAALMLAGGTFLAAGIIRLLPYSPPAGSAAGTPHPGRTFLTIVSFGPLRRTLYLTVVVALSVAVLPVMAVVSTASMGVDPAAAGALIAAYGFGNIAGSIGVMIRPARGDADQLMTSFAVAVATALTTVALAPTFAIALIAYAVAGVLNACFFATTLAARSEYAPIGVRAQVFVWVGALKITAGSAGTALAGAIIATALYLPIVIGVGLTMTVAVISVLERRNRLQGSQT